MTEHEMWAEARAAEERKLKWRLFGLSFALAIQVAVLIWSVFTVLDAVAAAGNQQWAEATYRLLSAWFALYVMGGLTRVIRTKR